MATASTGWSCTHGVSTVSETNTSKTIRVTCYWTNNGWTYNINHVSAWVYCGGSSHQVKDGGSVNATSSSSQSVSMGYYDFTITKSASIQKLACYAKITSSSSYVSGTKSSSSTSTTVAAKPSYVVSYSANGGSGAPGNQTKWYGTNLTLSTSKPSRTGYSFAGWNTNSSGTGTNYASGATYTGNAALTLYAKWTPNTYTVSYNANGGSGAPGNQTKTYGVNLTLSSTKPTRTNYNFKGWSTSASGGVIYASGATYTNNSAVTLYAVWELAYVKPRITNFKAYRCTSDGTASETGTYIKASFDWSTDYALVSMYIDWTVGTDWANRTSEKVNTSGTSGSVSQIVGGGNISTETTYSTRGWVNDGQGSTYSEVITIGTVKFPIDVKAGGTGVAIGKVAESDIFEVDMPAKFNDTVDLTSINNNVHWDTWTENGDANNFTRSGTYYLGGASTNTPDGNGYVRLFVSGYNQQGDLAQIGMPVSRNQMWARTSANGTWNEWRQVPLVGEVLDTGLIKGAWNDPTRGAITIKTDNSGAQHSAIVGLKSDGSTRLYGMDLLDSNDSPTIRLYAGSGWMQLSNAGNVSCSGTFSPSSIIAHSSICTSLYDNSSGTNGTVTLSQTANNFNYLEIFYVTKHNTNTYGSVKIFEPNGKIVNLVATYCKDTTYGVYVYAKDVQISGTTITVSKAGWQYIGSDRYIGSSDYIYITKVVGYK